MSSFNLRFGGANLSVGDAAGAEEIPEGLPFRLLVVGNFTGHRTSGLTDRKPVFVDRDEFENVMAKVAPRLTLPGAGGKDEVLTFQSLEDFEPDSLYSRLGSFKELRDLSSRLNDSRGFEEAAAVIRGWIGESSAPAAEPPPSPPQAQKSGAELLADILGEPAPTVKTPVNPLASDWDKFLHGIVQPHLVERPNPKKADYEAVLEEATGARMRSILHHPDFQALEAAWRSVFFLIRRLPTDEDLKVYLLDLSASEIDQDLTRDEQSILLREVVIKTVGTQGGQPWVALVLLDDFGKTTADLERLGKLTVVSAQARTPVLAAVSPKLLGCPSLTGEPDARQWKPDVNLIGLWNELRGLAETKYLGAVMPRVLMRLPYGDGGATTDRTSFEELPPGSPHEHFLWGAGSVALGLLLAEGFVQSGWGFDPNENRDVSGLPVYVYEDDGERTVKPCAEVLLRENAFETMIGHGLMVLVSTRDRDSVQLSRFQSAAKPATPLAGRW
jgi:type VI secretion system protein ImpC